MGVYIPGTEMPAIELEWNIRRGADGKWYAIDTNAETSDGEWHEIVPVPPHGDLIDRQVVKNDWFITEGGTRAVAVVDIDAAPTIIPANSLEKVAATPEKSLEKMEDEP